MLFISFQFAMTSNPFKHILFSIPFYWDYHLPHKFIKTFEPHTTFSLASPAEPSSHSAFNQNIAFSMCVVWGRIDIY